MAILSGKTAMKKFQVKLRVMKLDGFIIEDEISAKMAVEIKFDEKIKMGISSLYKKSQSFFTKQIDVVKMGEDIEFNHEFNHVCNFSMISKFNNLFASSMAYFNIFYGKNEGPSSSSSKTKMQLIGKGGLNLGELASKMEPQMLQRIPISLEVDKVAIEANLLVLVSFNEMKPKAHSRTMSSETFTNQQNSSDVTKLLRRAKSQGPTTIGHENVKKNKMLTFFSRQLSWKSRGNESEGYVVVASTSRAGDANTVAELGRTTTSEAQLDMAKKGGFWKWKRRKSMKNGVTPEIVEPEAEKSINPGTWQIREITSRDTKTKVNVQVFFASFDQRSEKAAGESACAAIVAVIAHRLQQNPTMLSGLEFDQLITEGSTEWRNLCNDDTHKDVFPDKHFDLETIIRAELRPLVVHPNDSHFGFFHPEEFDHLKDAKSFDKIWDDINENVSDFESRVYIVRWNEHFFVMKVEAKANYIIDSLGERLYEGCNNAYILKFDESSVMYSKKDSKDGKGGEDEVICRGKACCREYMKRFLAAIPVRELKEQEAKGKTVEMSVLHQRLLIDFYLSAHSSSSVSPNTSPLFLGDEDLVV
ncbi:hypothetical protein RND81_10G151800 [Saponaria officinalis]|uniref:C2 NT-type domain-containing protein n=1 Tax=Saponaria officinalis TaxID=3572 RepID=A0AAW1I2B5_SAPOF